MENVKRKYYIGLLLGFILFYFFEYGFYGFNDADDGFTLASSWRIFHGEIPYRDFILVRPPLSPLFHTLTLYLIPINYQIIFERLLCYVLLALSSLFCSIAIDNVFNLKDNFKISPYLLSIIGFIFSTSNFPPMPWHTIDGIFFASLGVWVLVTFSSSYSIICGMMFLFFSALCKQNFYLVPLAGISFIVVTSKNWRKSVISIGTLTLFSILFITILYKLNALTNFIKMTTASTKVKDLLSAGIISYLGFRPLYIILPLGFWITATKFSSKFLWIRKLVPYLFISLPLLYPLAKFSYSALYKSIPYNPVNSTFFRDDTAQVLFILSVFLLIANFELEKKWVTLCFLTLISWCVGISWGYVTPALFSTPLLFCFLIASDKYFHIKLSNIAIYLLVIGTLTYYIAYQKPYCNPVRSHLVYELSDVFPKLDHIRVGRYTYEKYHDFRSLVDKYGTNFKTLPGMPLSNYLTDTNSPIAADWVFNAEVNNDNGPILNMLSRKKTVVFVEKKPQLISFENSKDKFNSSLTFYIEKDWVKIDSTRFFDVYVSPDAGNSDQPRSHK